HGDAPKLDGRQVRKAKGELQAPFDRAGGENPYRLPHAVQAMMKNLVGIFRTAEDLEEAIGHIGDLRKRWGKVRTAGAPAYNPGWTLVCELRNMLICSEAVARSALQRSESRGAHARIDHPGLDDEWGKQNNTVWLDGEQMRLEAPPPPPH